MKLLEIYTKTQNFYKRGDEMNFYEMITKIITVAMLTFCMCFICWITSKKL